MLFSFNKVEHSFSDFETIRFRGFEGHEKTKNCKIKTVKNIFYFIYKTKINKLSRKSFFKDNFLN